MLPLGVAKLSNLVQVLTPQVLDYFANRNPQDRVQILGVKCIRGDEPQCCVVVVFFAELCRFHSVNFFGSSPSPNSRRTSAGSNVALTSPMECVMRRMWKANPPAMRWQSLRQREHRVETLQPYPHSSVTTERQAKCIADLPRLVDDISARKHQGWVLLGPTGCSKSTYVASVLYEVETSDFITMAWDDLAPRSFVHRVRVGDWLQEMHEWQTRSFGSTVKKPSVTPEKIAKSLQKAGLVPVLWLEELDKVAMTPARADSLFRLVDAVYELEGTIIVTANATGGAPTNFADQPCYTSPSL